MIRGARRPISIHSPTVRTFFSPEGVHQDHGDHGGRTSDTRHYSHTIPGRPVTKRTVRNTVTTAPPRVLSVLGTTRVDAEFSEVTTSSVAATGVLRSMLDTRRQRIFLPKKKIQSIQNLTRKILCPCRVSVHLCILMLGKMVASFEAIQFGRFHSRQFQLDLLFQWSSSHLQMSRMVRLAPRRSWNQSISVWLSWTPCIVDGYPGCVYSHGYISEININLCFLL